MLQYNSIFLKNDKEEYMIIEKYKIKDEWKISLGYNEFNQYSHVS